MTSISPRTRPTTPSIRSKRRGALPAPRKRGRAERVQGFEEKLAAGRIHFARQMTWEGSPMDGLIQWGAPDYTLNPQ